LGFLGLFRFYLFWYIYNKNLLRHAHVYTTMHITLDRKPIRNKVCATECMIMNRMQNTSQGATSIETVQVTHRY
jgi:hypothetical protein